MMYYRTIRNDVLRNKAITLTTMLFIAAAAMLVALAAVLVVNLAGAIATLMTQAKTPHFTQMHAGELDTARLAAFAQQHEAVADFQALEFLNLDGAQFVFASGSLATSVQDNGLAMQSARFDFLLDLDGKVITVWSVVTAELADPTLLNEKIAAYADRFAFAKVSDIDEYIRQTYGATINAIGTAAYAAVGVALTIIVLITLLFMRMLVAKDRYAIAVMKALPVNILRNPSDKVQKSATSSTGSRWTSARASSLP